MGLLSKSFRMFEVETQCQYIDRMEVETPQGKLKGRKAFEYNLEKYDSIEAVFGGRHYLDYVDKPGGKMVVPHYHYYIKLTDSRKLSTILTKINGVGVNDNNYIAPDMNNPNSLCVGAPQVNNIHSSFSECYDYLLHRDKKSLANPCKHQYTEEEVEIYIYGATVEEIEADTERNERGKIKSPGMGFAEEFIGLYGEKISSGEITRSKMIKEKNLVPDEDYIKYKTCFDRMFERQEMIRLAEINKGGMAMEVIYIWGKPGSGKTTYAKEYAKAHNKDYFISGSSNDAFDGYLGEPVIILDDLRGSAFSFSDLLKILDNNTRSKVKSRYYNKVVTCETIIITSIMPIEELYNRFNNEEYSEPLEQLKRRCKTLMRFDDDTVTLYHWSARKGKYDLVGKVPNMYKKMYQADELETDEEKLEFATKLFGDIGKSMQDVANYMTINKQDILDDFEQLSIDELPGEFK